jgi:hypothetical protein
VLCQHEQPPLAPHESGERPAMRRGSPRAALHRPRRAPLLAYHSGQSYQASHLTAA